MKKLLLSLALAFIVIFAGCGKEIKPSDEGLNSNAKSVQTQNIINLADEELLEKIIIPMEVANITDEGNGLLFENSTELSTDELLQFYIYSLGDMIPDDILELYFQEDKLEIPITEVKKQLDTCFLQYNLDLNSVNNTSYEVSGENIIFWEYDGFGGNRFAKIIERANEEKLIIVTVDFFDDEEYIDKSYSKTYTFELHDDGYFIKSITAIKDLA